MSCGVIFWAIAVGLWLLSWLSSSGIAGERALGVVILGIPLLVNSCLAVTLSTSGIRARIAERSERITSFREQPIMWPGIVGSVGLRLEIEIAHALPPSGILSPLKILIGGAERPAANMSLSASGRLV